jgi:hypothetical protein
MLMNSIKTVRSVPNNSIESIKLSKTLLGVLLVVDAVYVVPKILGSNGILLYPICMVRFSKSYARGINPSIRVY